MDSTTDNSFRTLWGIMKAAGTPDYLANGTLVDGDDAKSLPDTAFADIVHRRFPITDRANTWASAGYFAKTASECGYSRTESDCVLANIRRAASIYGIGDDVDGVMSKVASHGEEQEKTAGDEGAYCDPEHRGYPVFDKEGAALANDFFSKNAYKYGHERRMGIARNILRKCAEFGVDADEQVRMSAGSGFPNRETLCEHLMFRGQELLDRGLSKMAHELCKFAEEICTCSDDDLFRNRDGLFDSIAGIDEVSGIDDCYGKKFCAPEELVYEITPDSMREVVEDIVPLCGESLSAKALSGLPRALFERVLPKEVVDGMTEDGKLSPKKVSVTIISLKSPEQRHLMRELKGFENGEIDVDDDDVDEGDDDKAEGKEGAKGEGEDGDKKED